MKKALLSGAMSALMLVALVIPVAAQAPDGVGREAAQERAAARQAEREERVEEIRQRVEERRAEVKQDICERREAQLQRLIPKLSTSATTLLGNFDKIYERVVGFYEEGQLAAENYDELKAAVDTAQTEATATVEAVQAYEFELDCEVNGVGQQLDGFREAVSLARESVHDYRESLVALISALRAEVEDDDDSDSEIEDENEEDEEDESGDDPSEGNDGDESEENNEQQ